MQISRTAKQTYERGGTGLADETRQAIATEGRSVVERYLNEDEPPRMINCTTDGCNPVE